MNKISRAGKLLKEIYETLEIKKERTVMKRIRKLTTAFLVIALLVTSLVSAPAFADTEPEVVRIAGDSRYLTAIEVSKKAYDSTTSTVVIASGENFPDALAGSVLAHKLGAPILLAKKDSIDDKTLAQIKGLGATKVTILGGEKAIDDSVFDVLAKKGYAVTRIAGENRYETAAKIAAAVKAPALSQQKVFLATGENYADALAIGPYAAANGIPILLTKSDALHADTVKALKALKVEKVSILGGEKAVAPAVVASLNALGIDSERIEGKNRELTALAIAEEYKDQLSPTELIAVTGNNFADAVVGGYFGASKATTGADSEVLPMPIVLVRDEVAKEVDDYIREGSFNTLYILGGPKAVSEENEDTLERALLNFALKLSTATGNIFFKGVGPNATGAVFVFDDTFTDAELKFGGLQLKESLSQITVDGTNSKITLTETWLKTLAVGEHKVALTIDGFAMPALVVTVKDDSVATLIATLDDDEFPLGDKALVVTLEGYNPNPPAVAAGDKAYIDLTGVAVSVDGSALKSTGVVEFTTSSSSGYTITVLQQYIGTLKAGDHEVTVKLADGRTASASFEITDDSEIEITELSLQMTVHSDTDLDITIKGVGPDGSTAATIAKEKLSVTVGDTKLVAPYVVFADGKVTLKGGYLEDLAVGEYAVVVSYDGNALDPIPLYVTPDLAAVAKSKVTVAPEVALSAIVPVTIELKDVYGNPVAGDVVTVKLSKKLNAFLSRTSDMAISKDADNPGVTVTTDAAGKATVYFRSFVVDKDLTFTVTTTLGPVTLTSNAFDVD